MQKYSVLMTLGLLLMLLFGLQLSASPATTPAIEAEVNIHPETFHLEQRGVITATISNLTEEDTTYEIEDVNASTIVLYHENTFVAEPLRVTVEDNVLIVKFDATVVADYIWSILYHMGITTIPPPDNYIMSFTVSGQLFNGETFAGSDTIKIIVP